MLLSFNIGNGTNMVVVFDKKALVLCVFLLSFSNYEQSSLSKGFVSCCISFLTLIG